MERGLFIGGVLIFGSIGLAMMLNLSGRERTPALPATPAVMKEDVAVAPPDLGEGVAESRSCGQDAASVNERPTQREKISGC